jgi:hypothetical protein
MNWIMANSRKVTLGILVGLAALSNVPLYSIQGALLTGHTLENWPLQFWLVEWSFWGLRSIIEMGVIYYMLVTKPENKYLAWALYAFETLAISLILLTLGSAAIALDAKDQLMVESLGLYWSGIVKFGIVGYLPVIIGGAAVAYKAQPDVVALNQAVTGRNYEQDFLLIEQERNELKQKVGQLQQAFGTEKKKVDAALVEQRQIAMQVIQAVDYLKTMTPFRLVAIMTVLWNSHRPGNKDIMGLLNVSMPTVIKGIQAGEKILPHVKEYLEEE